MNLKAIIVSVLFLGFWPFMSHAQSSPVLRADVNIEADIISTIELITVNNIRLRNFQPEQGEVYISPVENPYAGHLVAIGIANADIRIEYLPQRILTQPEGDGVIVFNYQIAGSTIDNQITSELLLNDNRNFQFNEQGRFYLWIGGTVDVSQAKPGSYQGEFTIEIEYI